MSGLIVGGFLSYADGIGMGNIFAKYELLLPSLIASALIGIVAMILGTCVGEIPRRIIAKPTDNATQALQGEQKLPSRYIELADTLSPPEPVPEDFEPVTERKDNIKDDEEDEDLPSYLKYGQFEEIPEDEELSASPKHDAPKRFFSPRNASVPKIEASRPNTARAAHASKIKYVEDSPGISPQGDTKTTHISYLEEDFESDAPPQHRISLIDVYRRPLSVKVTASKPAFHALIMRGVTFFVTEAAFYYCLLILRAEVLVEPDEIRVLTTVLVIGEFGGFCMASGTLRKVIKKYPICKIWTMFAVGHGLVLLMFLPAAVYGGALAASVVLPSLICCAHISKSMASFYLYDAVHPCEFDQLEKVDEVAVSFSKAIGCIVGVFAAVITWSYSLWPCLVVLALGSCAVPLYLQRVRPHFQRYNHLIEA